MSGASFLLKKTADEFSHRLFLYAIGSCQRILEDSDFRCQKGEYNEEQGNGAKKQNSPFWRSAEKSVFVEKPRLVDINNCGRHKENGDVKPIGRLADHTVAGVKENGNQRKAKKNPPKLDTPKILPITEEKALRDSKKEHRNK